MQVDSIASLPYSALRSLYNLLPQGFQRKLLRVISSLRLPETWRVLVCRDYIQLHIHNVEKIAVSYGKTVNFYTLIEENKSATAPAVHLPTQALEAIQPCIARTETVVLEITDQRFSLRNYHLFDSQMNVIDEPGLNFEKMPVYRKRLAKQVSKIKGTLAYLSNVEPTNYYHWMCRTLPLLRTYQQCFDIAEIDFFYIGEFPLASFHQESLVRAGIQPDQVIQTACTADRILAALANRTHKSFGAAPVIKENYLFSRGLFQTDIDRCLTTQTKRIYVSRGNAKRRKVLNESQVILLLKQYGFETVAMDDKTLQDQIHLFANAEAIVAPHGAALTNLLFIRPGTKVIELIPDGYVNNCFYALANYGNAEYYYLQGESTAQQVEQHRLDLKINISQLEQLCQIVFP